VAAAGLPQRLLVAMRVVLAAQVVAVMELEPTPEQVVAELLT
jgi:hypothetical protein